MVLLLFRDVVPHGFDLRKANRKNSVSILPAEIPQVCAFGFDPERGATLYFLDHFCRLASTRERREDMNVIFNTSDEDGLAVMAG